MNDRNGKNNGKNQAYVKQKSTMLLRRRCFNCQKTGHIAKGCRVRKKQVYATFADKRKFGQNQAICFKCQQKGHIARKCRKKFHLNEQTLRM